MPKICKNESQVQDLSLQATIDRHLRLRGITKKELAVRLHMGLPTLFNKIREPEKFTLGELRRLGRELKIEEGEKAAIW